MDNSRFPRRLHALLAAQDIPCLYTGMTTNRCMAMSWLDAFQTGGFIFFGG
jgi:hypothetical protein